MSVMTLTFVMSQHQPVRIFKEVINVFVKMASPEQLSIKIAMVNFQSLYIALFRRKKMYYKS